MPGSFDPYHKWLGISPKDQPPNHYRLLAIDLLESDPDVISSAADQRMAHVRAFQTGKHSALSQEILNEIAAARICLLNAEKKAEYDRQLNQVEPADDPDESPPEPPVMPLIPPVVPPLDETVPPRFEGPSVRPRTRRKKVTWQAVAGISAAVVFFVVVLVILLNRDGSQDIAQSDPGGQTSVEPKPPQDPDTDPEPTDPRTPPDNDPDEPGPDPQSNPPPHPSPSDPDAQVTQAVDPGSNPAAEPSPEPEPEKPPPPDAATETALEERLKDILAGESAAELLQAAQTPDRAPDESYVLLKKALDSAVASADVSTALAAADELVERYEIDALETRVETLAKLRTSVTDPSTARALAESGFALVDEAVAGGRDDLAVKAAEDTVDAARRSDDNALYRRAVLRFINLTKSS